MKEASIVDMIAEEERWNRERNEARKLMHSCYECNKAKAEPVLLEGSDVPYNERDRIHFVHDMVCQCGAEDIGMRLSCRIGEAEFRGVKCANCKHGKCAITATHISSTPTMKVIHELYSCSAPRHVRGRKRIGEYYRSYYRCEQFEEKEN